MAFASVGTLGSNESHAASTTVEITTLAAAEVDNLITVITAWDNTATSDGDTTNLSVTDSAGNTYVKAKEYTNTQAGAAADGITAALFYSVVSNELALGGTITVTSDTSRTAKVAQAWEFSKGAGTTVEVADVTELLGAGADPAAITLGSLPNQEYLFFWAYGIENNLTSNSGATNWTAMSFTTTASGASTVNASCAGAFRILTSTGVTVDPTTGPDGNEHVSILAAFEEVAGGSDATVSVPLATVSVDAPAPAVSTVTNATVSVPVAAVSVAGLSSTRNYLYPADDLYPDTDIYPGEIEAGAATVLVPLADISVAAPAPVAAVDKAVSVPTATVTVAGVAPALVTSSTLSIPTATVSVAGVVPAVATGSGILVPSAGVTVAGQAPSLVTTSTLAIPTATVTVAGVAPSVVRSSTISIPAATVTVAGVVPGVVVPIMATVVVPPATVSVAGGVPSAGQTAWPGLELVPIEEDSLSLGVM